MLHFSMVLSMLRNIFPQSIRACLSPLGTVITQQVSAELLLLTNSMVLSMLSAEVIVATLEFALGTLGFEASWAGTLVQLTVLLANRLLLAVLLLSSRCGASVHAWMLCKALSSMKHHKQAPLMRSRGCSRSACCLPCTCLALSALRHSGQLL
jgi:hypothetical protein